MIDFNTPPPLTEKEVAALLLVVLVLVAISVGAGAVLISVVRGWLGV